MLTGLKNWMIEGQLLATAPICKTKGQQLVGALRSNELQPYLPVRLSIKKGQQWFERLYICNQFSMSWWTLVRHSPRPWRIFTAESTCAKILWCSSKQSKTLWNTTLFENEKEDETVELQFCSTGILDADLLTKALSKAKVDQHRQTLIRNCKKLI